VTKASFAYSGLRAVRLCGERLVQPSPNR